MFWLYTIEDRREIAVGPFDKRHEAERFAALTKITGDIGLTDKPPCDTVDPYNYL